MQRALLCGLSPARRTGLACAAFGTIGAAIKNKAIIENGEDSHISAALTLFVAIYNIFTGLLRILLAVAGEE